MARAHPDESRAEGADAREGGADPGGARGGDWRSALAQLGGAAPDADARPDSPSGRAGRRTPGDVDGLRRLGLQFEPRHRLARRDGQWQGPRDETARRAAQVDRIGLRPVVRTPRGAWVKEKLSWQNVAFQASAARIDPAQSRWFAQFAALKGPAPTFGGYGSDWLTLEEFESPLFWALLAEAHRLGIALVGSDAVPTVELASTAELGFDVREASAGLVLAPSLRLDGVVRSPVGVRPIGGHGLAVPDFAAGVLRLAPLRHPLTPIQAGLLDAAEPIVVPAAEAAEFVGVHLPALVRQVPVFSADGSFLPPPPSPSVLVLRAVHLPAGRLGLDWSWRRGDGVELAIGAADAAFDEPRSRRAAVLARVREVLEDWSPDAALGAEARLAPGPAAADPAAPAASILDPVQPVPDGLGMPASAVLADADAASFAVEVLPGLGRLDGVELASSGEPPAYRHAADPPELHVTRVPAPGNDWLDLGVLVTVGGVRVPFQPLFIALATGAKRLKLVDHSYLRLDRPELDPLRELLDEAGLLPEWTPEPGVPQPRPALTSEFEDLAEFAEPAVAWRELVRGLDDAAVEPLPAPGGLAATLRPYQLDGFRRLAFLAERGLGGILADDMGLGKTVQTLALVLRLLERGPDARRPFLVVAPTSVVTNWLREAERFAPALRVALLADTASVRHGRLAATAADVDLVVTSYAVLRLAASDFAALDWAGLVLDEAQAVKNPATKTHAAAAGIRAGFRLALTGTPVENHLGELWSILVLVAPGLFPSRRAFTEHYRRPIEHGDLDRLDTLRRRIRPLVLRRTKELVAPELPAKQEQVLAVDLAPAHRRLYDAMLQRERQKLLDLVEEDRARFILYRSITLLRMLALDASLIDAEAYRGVPSAKLEALLEQLEDVLEEGHRALVFSQFTSFLDRIGERLDQAGVPFARLDGSTSLRRRDAEIRRFREGGAPVFLISLKAGGVGLNLTEADYVFLADPWWNPASENQAVDRAHRIGQERQVMVYRLVASGTIEEKVMALGARKAELATALFDAGDAGDAGGGAAGTEDAGGGAAGTEDAGGGAAGGDAARRADAGATAGRAGRYRPADASGASALTAAELRALLDD